MRALAKSIVEAAALTAGMPKADIMEKPEKPSALLPVPRLEFETPGGLDIKRSRRLFVKLPAEDPDYVVHRFITHNITVKARVVIIGKSSDYVEAFFVAFMQALPGKTKDSKDNLVTVDPQRATTGGYEYKMIEAFPERNIPVWITFKGGLYEDVEVPYVKSINLVDGINYN